MLGPILIASLLVPPLAAADVASTPEADNKETVRRFVETVLDGGDFDQAARFVSDDFANPRLPSSTGGVAELIETERFRRQVFPDLSFEIEDLMAEGDRVMVMLRLRGTHTGEVMGTAPTGNALDMKVVRIYRLADSKIVEGRELSDLLQLYRATGYRMEGPAAPRPANGD